MLLLAPQPQAALRWRDQWPRGPQKHPCATVQPAPWPLISPLAPLPAAALRACCRRRGCCGATHRPRWHHQLSAHQRDADMAARTWPGAEPTPFNFFCDASVSVLVIVCVDAIIRVDRERPTGMRPIGRRANHDCATGVHAVRPTLHPSWITNRGPDSRRAPLLGHTRWRVRAARSRGVTGDCQQPCKAMGDVWLLSSQRKLLGAAPGVRLPLRTRCQTCGVPLIHTYHRTVNS